MTRAFIMPDFKGFERKKGFIPVQYVSMTQYDETFTGLKVVNPPESLENTLGEYLSKLGKTQAHIAETQKYAHVTFFFNGGVEAPNPGEERFLIDSPKVATFDMKPEMSAPEVTRKALDLIDSGKYDVMILNYANCDMVGHTGVLPAAIEAVKEIDKDVGILAREILKLGGQRRPDDRPRYEGTLYRPYHQPRALHRLRRRPGRQDAALRRPPGRHRADHAHQHGCAGAQGNDRKEPD